MAELFFIATTIFVAYVFFVALGDKTPSAPTLKPDDHKSDESVVEKAGSSVSNASASAQDVKAPAAKPAGRTSANAADSIRNPKTGEVSKVPTNYAFAKRWIKDALVAEGLLEKVYKNNELDEAISGKIAEALQQLRALEKYQ
jgi:hypothetical protein